VRLSLHKYVSEAKPHSIEMRVVFLDRDGVINKEPGNGDYVKGWSEFKFLPGAIEAIKMLNARGYLIVVISNQAGVAKGIYSQEALGKITQNMLSEIEKAGGKIYSVYYCIHRDEDACDCRKPKTGLIQKAFAELKESGLAPEDIHKTYFIGDTIRDIKTGRNAGLRTVLVLSGKEKIDNKDNWEVRPDYIFQDLRQAAEYLTVQDR
jgi:histidinol-phosphate phosphatase family protein